MWAKLVVSQVFGIAAAYVTISMIPHAPGFIPVLAWLSISLLLLVKKL